MKKIIKYFGTILLSILFLFGNINKLNAASGSISVSSGTNRIVVGNTFSVTVRISSSVALGSWEWVINYDTSKFKLTSGEKNVADVFQNTSTKSKSYTYKFKAIATGSGKISVKSYGAIALSDNKNISLSVGSKTVNVITQAQLEASYSKNNNLKSLSVDGYKLSPTFSKDVTEYTVEAGSNVEKIKIKATAEDSKSDVSGSGTHEVSEGENKFNITVKAENNSTKTYKITVNVVDPNPINVTIDDKKFIIVKRESNMETPQGFTKTTVEINSQNIPAFYNELNNFTLVGLKDEEGIVNLYLYNKETNTYETYDEVSLNEIKLYPLEIDKSFDSSYKETKVSIGGITFNALKMDNSDYYIIHARDLLIGKNAYYTYDSINNSVIRFTDENLKPLLEEINNYKLIIMVLGIETVLIVFVLIGILIVKIKNKKKKRKLYQQELLKRKKLEESENEKGIETKKEENSKEEENKTDGNKKVVRKKSVRKKDETK